MSKKRRNPAHGMQLSENDVVELQLSALISTLSLKDKRDLLDLVQTQCAFRAIMRAGRPVPQNASDGSPAASPEAKK